MASSSPILAPKKWAVSSSSCSSLRPSAATTRGGTYWQRGCQGRPGPRERSSHAFPCLWFCSSEALSTAACLMSFIRSLLFCIWQESITGFGCLLVLCEEHGDIFIRGTTKQVDKDSRARWACQHLHPHTRSQAGSFRERYLIIEPWGCICNSLNAFFHQSFWPLYDEDWAWRAEMLQFWKMDDIKRSLWRSRPAPSHSLQGSLI